MHPAPLRPYLLFWLAMPFLLVLGYAGEEVFDVQWADQYWLLDRAALGWSFAGYLGIVGTAYWLLAQRGRQPGRALTFIHLLATVGFFALVSSYPAWTSEYRGELIELTQAEALKTIQRRFSIRQITLGTGAVFFALAQLAFAVNVVLASIRQEET